MIIVTIELCLYTADALSSTVVSLSSSYTGTSIFSMNGNSGLSSV